MDDQVKIRGYLIEPGEIAVTLRLHPRVGDAVVITRDDAAGRPRLIGYAATDATPEELRAFLAARLPSYMVPDHLIPMAALPWNRNGKVDKAALPAPDTVSRGELAPTRTQTERRLATLWQDLLGVTAVGADDDFFGLGGYSLLVAKMLALVSDEFGRSVPLSTFLAAPTLADLASAIGEAAPAGSVGQPGTPGTVGDPDDEPDDEFDLDTLSDAEAAAMLAVLTSEGDGA
jgi:hypothetical protein